MTATTRALEKTPSLREGTMRVEMAVADERSSKIELVIAQGGDWPSANLASRCRLDWKFDS